MCFIEKKESLNTTATPLGKEELGTTADKVICSGSKLPLDVISELLQMCRC
jgi:hypothetical protein